MLQLASQLTEVRTTLSHMSSDMGEMKADLKEIVKGAPMHRIEVLEARWKAAFTWLGMLSLVVIGAIVTAWFTR